MAAVITVLPRSTIIFTFSFADEDEEAVTPVSANWTLTDSEGNVINSRSAVAISPLATTADIVLSGDDTARISTDTQRILTVSGTYNSDLADDPLPFKQQATFYVDGLPGSY